MKSRLTYSIPITVGQVFDKLDNVTVEIAILEVTVFLRPDILRTKSKPSIRGLSIVTGDGNGN